MLTRLDHSKTLGESNQIYLNSMHSVIWFCCSMSFCGYLGTWSLEFCCFVVHWDWYVLCMWLSMELSFSGELVDNAALFFLIDSIWCACWYVCIYISAIWERFSEDIMMSMKCERFGDSSCEWELGWSILSTSVEIWTSSYLENVKSYMVWCVPVELVGCCSCIGVFDVVARSNNEKPEFINPEPIM